MKRFISLSSQVVHLSLSENTVLLQRKRLGLRLLEHNNCSHEHSCCNKTANHAPHNRSNRNTARRCGRNRRAQHHLARQSSKPCRAGTACSILNNRAISSIQAIRRDANSAVAHGSLIFQSAIASRALHRSRRPRQTHSVSVAVARTRQHLTRRPGRPRRTVASKCRRVAHP